ARDRLQLARKRPLILIGIARADHEQAVLAGNRTRRFDVNRHENLTLCAHAINGSVGTSGGRSRMAAQCCRNAARRSSTRPLAFQCRPPRAWISLGGSVPSLAITIVGWQRPSA